MVADSTVIPFAFELKDLSLPLVTVVLHQADAGRPCGRAAAAPGRHPQLLRRRPGRASTSRPLREHAEDAIAFDAIVAALRATSHAARAGHRRQRGADGRCARGRAARRARGHAPAPRPRTVEVERR
jgi:hypothetical protein